MWPKVTSLTSVDFQGWLRKLRRDDDNKEIEIYGHSKALFPTLWRFPRILKGKHCILQLLLLSLLGIFFGPSDMQGFGMPDHSVSAAICRGHFPGYKALGPAWTRLDYLLHWWSERSSSFEVTHRNTGYWEKTQKKENQWRYYDIDTWQDISYTSVHSLKN